MATYTKITKAEAKNIGNHYGINVIEVTPIDGGNANSNYHIQTEKEEYILTLAEEKGFKGVENLANLLSWLITHHFSTSQIRPSIKDELVTDYIGKPVMMKRWITGTVCKKLNAEMLQEAGSALATLHQIPIPGFLPELPPHGLQMFSAVTDRGIDTEYEHWIKERIQYLKKHLPLNLPKGLIHGDLFFDNILFENEQLKAIIDFEEACHYFLAFDLGMSIIGLCIDNGKIDLVKVSHLIKGYEQIRQLEALEKESLMFFTEYAAISTSWWRFWKYNIHSPSPGLRNKHWEMVHIAKEANLLSNENFKIFST